MVIEEEVLLIEEEVLLIRVLLHLYISLESNECQSGFD